MFVLHHNSTNTSNYTLFRGDVDRLGPGRHESGSSRVLCPLSELRRDTDHRSFIHQRRSRCSSELFEDVVKEVKRGRKLQCHKCKKKGATAGCEVKRCKRSYHFPCAVKKGAKVIEDPAKGSYGLYCSQHQPLQNTQSNGVVNRLNSDPSEPGTSNNHSGAGSTKVHCLTCEKKEGNLGPDSLSNAIVMCSCDKHAPSSYKRNDGSMAARLIVFTSDSDSSRSPTHSPVKRRLNRNTLEESPSKRKTKGRTFRTDEDSLNSESAIFAPLESDIDESANSVLEQQVGQSLCINDFLSLKPTLEMFNKLKPIFCSFFSSS
ncbi:uncharacterized protein phf11 isoform X3 [Paralichthys olivaceus]|uniref:uncharacterized protein phf11 isoform X3 n=1 Tax=Paralichthys olivaceus TaxID=8255 RepID=UPI00375160A9